MKIKVGDLILSTDKASSYYFQIAEVVKVNENSFISEFSDGYRSEFYKDKMDKRTYKKLLIE